jgi:hypothetical protein
MITAELEVPMQKWPFADIGYLNVDHLRSMPKEKDAAPAWEYLMVEAVFVSENAVMFFDHYAKKYKKQRSELDEYLEKLGADGWKLTVAGNLIDEKAYRFRRYQFRRVTG